MGNGMTSNLERFKADLAKLLETAKAMSEDLTLQAKKRTKPLWEVEEQALEKIQGMFDDDYQSWYTEAAAVVRQVIPQRADEFMGLYESDRRRKSLDAMTYFIQDWLVGLRVPGNWPDGKRSTTLALRLCAFACKSISSRPHSPVSKAAFSIFSNPPLFAWGNVIS